MFRRLFSSSITIPTLRLTGVIGQTGMFRSGLTLSSMDKQINKLFNILLKLEPKKPLEPVIKIFFFNLFNLYNFFFNFI